jgi:hypothetical protein
MGALKFKCGFVVNFLLLVYTCSSQITGSGGAVGRTPDFGIGVQCSSLAGSNAIYDCLE